MIKIDKLVKPENIAVIGASSHPEKIGYQILKNIIDGGFPSDKIFPVNPKSAEILGLKCYQSVIGVQTAIDLAVIVVPSPLVFDALKEAAGKGVSAVIIISAGFAEVGEEGRELQQSIADFCLERGIALLGPNCLGLINTGAKLNASFAQSMPQAGRVAFISQSGAIISSLIDWSHSASIGFSKVFSLGNKASLREADLLSYLYDDSETDVILAYLESLVVDPALTEVLIASAKKKPTIVLFGGKSSFGAKAAASHTGSIVSSYSSIKTYLLQAGVLIADTIEELLQYARVFSCYHKVLGNKTAIITNAGGPSIATSDSIAYNHLDMAVFSDETRAKLASLFRPECNLKNPVDLLGDASDLDYQKAIEIVAADPYVDAMIVLLTPQSATKVDETAKVIAAYQGEKPLLSSFVGGAILKNAKEIIERSGKSCFSYPEEAVNGLAALHHFSCAQPSLIMPVSDNIQLAESEKLEKLKKYDLPVLEYATCDNLSELLLGAERLGYPVVVKMADETAHKSDAGGVVLDIKNEIDLKAAAEKVGFPCIVGPMIHKKYEVFLGVKREENIGTTVVFGTGGIFAEILCDFTYRIAPISHEMALEMIHETKIGQILSGARNQKKYDLDRLAWIISNAANFVINHTNIKEVDFNPIIVDDNDFHMVDVRIIWQ